MFRLCITGDLGFEVWADIPGYEGLYQASTYGRIKNKRTEKILKPIKHHNGYYAVSLYGENKQKILLVHRIIAATFLPTPQDKPTINHKSEVKTENQVWNLEWCTHKYNNNYGQHRDKLSNSLKNNPKKSFPVIQFDLNGNYLNHYLSTREVERLFGFQHYHINECCNGKRKTAYGFKWQYAVES